MKKLFISIFLGLILTTLKSQVLSFNDVIIDCNISHWSGDQNIHGWAKDPDDVWRYHFNLDSNNDISFEMSVGLKRSNGPSGPNSFNHAIVYIILSHPTNEFDYYIIAPEIEFRPEDFSAKGSGGDFSRNKTVRVKIPKEQFPQHNFPLGWRISTIVAGKMSIYSHEPYSFKNYHKTNYKGVSINPIINGPEKICSDAIYSVYYADNVVLENTFGAATLTNLGGNNYRINVGSSDSGRKVLLKAVNNGIWTTKEIKVGAGAHLGTIKTFPSVVSSPGTYRIDFVDPGDDFESITSWSATSLTNSVRIDAGGPKRAYLNVDSWNSGSNTISITITGVTSCGETNTRTYLVGAHGSGGGGPEILDPDA